MNTARDRRNLALELSERTTDDLIRIMTARKPDRPDRFLHAVALRRAARHVIMARAITEKGMAKDYLSKLLADSQ